MSYTTSSTEVPWSSTDTQCPIPAAPAAPGTPAHNGRGENLEVPANEDTAIFGSDEGTTVPAAVAKPLGRKKLKTVMKKKMDLNTDFANGEPRGKLHPIAASMLMKVLYTARMARPDLLRAINRLACNITKWTMMDDIKLHRLMSYIKKSLSDRLTGWIGDPIR